jgi:TRAP-type C4-dicarboxylate transport system permease small subunit
VSVLAVVRRGLDALYWACVVLAGTALVLISAVIPWAVFTRYQLNSAASWPEPFAVLLTIVLTFFGAAACYRQGRHMSIAVFVGMLPDGLRRVVAMLAEMLVGVFAVFMAYYGARLVMATWYNTIPDFPELSVGVTYLPIPIGGAILLCFVLERITLGPPPAAEGEGRETSRLAATPTPDPSPQGGGGRTEQAA